MISTREDAALNGLLLLCVKRPRQTFIREVTSILTTDHQATTCCVIVFFITFVTNVGLDRFKRHSLCRGKHLCLNVSIVFNGLVLIELQRLHRRVIMVVLHWYNIAILNLLQISDRFQTDCIRSAIENYTRTSIPASQSDLPLWRTNFYKIHYGAVVVIVLCNFMDYECCKFIIFWSTYRTNSPLYGTVRRSTLEFIFITVSRYNGTCKYWSAHSVQRGVV